MDTNGKYLVLYVVLIYQMLKKCIRWCMLNIIWYIWYHTELIKSKRYDENNITVGNMGDRYSHQECDRKYGKLCKKECDRKYRKSYIGILFENIEIIEAQI